MPTKKLACPDVSRRRGKKGRLRRDARVCYRGVSGFYGPAIRPLPFYAAMNTKTKNRARDFGLVS